MQKLSSGTFTPSPQLQSTANEVPAVLHALGQHMTDLEQCTTALITRLQPVLHEVSDIKTAFAGGGGSGPSVGGGVVAVNVAPSTPVGREVDAYVTRAIELCARLQNTINRLGV